MSDKREKRFGDTIVIVPGFGDTPRMPWWGVLKRFLREEDSEVVIKPIDFSMGVKPPFMDKGKIKVPGTSIGSIKEYAEKLKDFLEKIDGEVDIIAHSLGGLVSRWYIEERGGDKKVDDLVTIATPHQGTHMAYIGFMTPAGREMIPGSELLCKLNHKALPENVNYTAVWSNFDHVFFQDWRSKLPENLVVLNSSARNVYVGDHDHHEMIVNKEVFHFYKNYIG